MAAYSNWEYYHDTYHGSLTKDQYERNAIKARSEVDRHTFGRAENAPESMQERLRQCECELIDATQSFADAYEMLPRGIASVTNDGFSASNTARGSNQSQQDSEQSVYRDICLKYLTRPINLMYRGVKKRGNCNV